MASRHPLYPFSLVWSPIPFVTWIAPFIGHLGVCSSDGRIRDFQGPGMIGVDAFLFGCPTRYLRLDPCKAAAFRGQASGEAQATGQGDEVSELQTAQQQWDSHLRSTCLEYGLMDYNIFTRNCHKFVSDFINSIQYQGSTQWTMVHLAALVFIKARFTGPGGFLATWFPFAVLMTLGVWFGRWIFIVCWGGLVSALCLWFFVYSHFMVPRCINDVSVSH